ncbi:MAG: DEAD/DEAH box helicase [Pseudohongiellaceae bacterium]
MSRTTAPATGFAALSLPDFLIQTLSRVGYESPTAIQQATIPPLLAGRDITGMAQTGTGKTAAFALPILAHIDVSKPVPQALVLCPTRELAIQVAEAFQTYASGMRGFSVLPIYGGQEMSKQLQALRRGVHVVVATPGRLLDHLRRRSINLSSLRTVVLDEADEMLRMGFIDDVESILQQTPDKRQVALFSATMPAVIRKVANKYLDNPEEVRIETAASTNDDIEQRYWLVQGTNKLDALTRLLEVEDFDGMIVFVRTRNSTVELADKLSARGFSAAPLNGDMNQNLRQRTVEQLKNGKLDILVATDVAARGLDVDRISHVLNYDIPHDNEAYVHRIGRTGRAGRSGKAILFVAPRERRLLQSIERTTRRKIDRLELPSRDELLQLRGAAFRSGVGEVVRSTDLSFFHELVSDLCREQECSIEDAAAAMASMLQKEGPVAARRAPTSSPVKAAAQAVAERSVPPRRKPTGKPAASTGKEAAPKRTPKAAPGSDEDTESWSTRPPAKSKAGRKSKLKQRLAGDRKAAKEERPRKKKRVDKDKGKRRKPAGKVGGQSGPQRT